MVISRRRAKRTTSALPLGLLEVDDDSKTENCAGVKVGDGGVTPVAWPRSP
jgi:hypothetical protein